MLQAEQHTGEARRGNLGVIVIPIRTKLAGIWGQYHCEKTESAENSRIQPGKRRAMEIEAFSARGESPAE